MCIVCGGTKTVKATEIRVKSGTAWVCETPLPGPPDLPAGLARCNRPEHVIRALDTKWGNTRKGVAPCPLCAKAELVSSETDDFGLPELYEPAPW